MTASAADTHSHERANPRPCAGGAGPYIRRNSTTSDSTKPQAAATSRATTAPHAHDR